MPGRLLLSLATVVVSLTLVAVQVAMAQFSPRIVRALLEDRRNQAAFGFFIGTFGFTMTVLRVIDDQASTIPGVSVLIDYLLILLSLVGLVLFVQHAGQALRVSGLIDLVGDSTRAELERLRPLAQRQVDDGRVIASPTSGNVVQLDEAKLVAVAAASDCRLELVPAMGEFVACGSPLFRVRGRLERPTDAVEGVLLEPERSHEDDASYGLRKLVDIAARSIASSPFDDPTTTVQALHRVHDCMRMLAVRELPSGRYHDSDGELRLLVPVLDWEGFVRLAFDEVRLVGASSPQVARALRAALEDIKTTAPPDREPALDHQLDLLTAAVKREYQDDADAEAALVPDSLGIGSGTDVIARDGSANGR